jgi:preprotein translocase subunit SecA
MLGLSVGVINHDASFLYDPGHKELDQKRDEVASFKVVHEFLRPVSRREAYMADITYGTNNEFGFDYLRDNIEYDIKNLRQREFNYAIVDEIDSILIDEARTPLIISAPTIESENLYVTFARIANQLEEGKDYEIDEKFHAITLTDDGISKAEKFLALKIFILKRVLSMFIIWKLRLEPKHSLKKRKNMSFAMEVVIVDEFTGRLQPGRRWSEGLHQAIEAKEGVAIKKKVEHTLRLPFKIISGSIKSFRV